MTDRIRVIYVGGYGRSGSTILDILLSRNRDVLGGGELWRLFEAATNGALCPCGRPIPDCALWGPTVRHVSSATGLSFERLHQASRAAEFSRKQGAAAEWSQIWTATFDFLKNTQGIACVVDSSKTSGGQKRAELLAKLPAVQLDLFIHLWRNPSGVLYSLARGSNRSLEAGRHDHTVPRILRMARGLAGWLRANRHAAHFRKSTTSRTVVVPYSILATRTVHTIENIFVLAGWPVRHEDQVDERHTVAGNRLARTPWSGRVSVDETWRSDLNPVWKLAGWGARAVARQRRWLE